ncbi:MAG: PAS domain-containing protein [Verrucomicrobiales bacterium]|nr:PAS domain-containing protein [Verrucomicrobiales bacterium]
MAPRTAELFKEQQQSIVRHTNQLFARLMFCQWAAGVVAALLISPRTWIGNNSQTHLHVWAAIILGGVVTSLPVLLALKQPGKVFTRHTIAVGQMLMSALLIHLSGGRIETHFHVFGSLALLAFYRDWRVLVSASIVVSTDHVLRGLFWPQSVYGVLAAPLWRSLEHAGWVIFEVTFLAISIRKSRSEMLVVAERQANLESLKENIEHTVADRTADLTREIEEHRKARESLSKSQAQLAQAQKIARLGSWEWDIVEDKVNWSDETCRLYGLQPDQAASSMERCWERLHPDDLSKVTEAFDASVRTHQPFVSDHRVLLPDGAERIMHGHAEVMTDGNGKAVKMIGTVRDITESKRAEEAFEKLHKQLVETSRQAGMAEVATGVLHNVGNVLNSVNVSATLIAEKVRASEVSNLPKICELLHNHANHLGTFMTSDPQGKLVPGFLTILAGHLATEQGFLLHELSSLQKSVEHIKEIVSMQQSYAKVSGILETLSITELIEDALRLNAAILEKHGVQLTRQFVDVPPLCVDRHKVLQILVNLIRNSVSALNERVPGERWLALQIAHAKNDGVTIAVTDNGVGIWAENLTRIFVHGFTTKRNGHGFGLHSGALAAKQMGGTLSVRSEGPGKGATFILQLPRTPENKT